MIQVLNRALDILEFIAEKSGEPQALSTIAGEVKIQSSTCANIVKTLVERGYLAKAEGKKGYILGRHIAHLLGANPFHEKLVKVGNKELSRLTAILNENTLIAILQNNVRKIICKGISNQQVQAQTPDEKDIYDTSSGRVLLAMQNDDFLHSYIQSYGLPAKDVWPEAKTEKGFFAQIEKIRKTGYILIEDSVQVIGFAAPIYMDGKPMAALSIYIPAFRYSDELRTSFIKLGLEFAELIGNSL